MTPRDRFSAPVIEDITEMEHTVQVNVKQLFQFKLWFLHLIGHNPNWLLSYYQFIPIYLFIYFCFLERERLKNVQFTRLKGSNKHSGPFHRHDPPPPNLTLLGDCIANLYKWYRLWFWYSVLCWQNSKAKIQTNGN